MAEQGTLDKFTWGFGRYIGEPEADDIQDAVEAALQHAHFWLTGYGVLLHPIALASAPPDLNVNLAPGQALTYEGDMCRWTGAQVIDVTNATAGTHLGATTVVGVGNRRYVVIGVTPSVLDEEPGTDYNGNPYNYKQTAQCDFEVYMSAEVLLADDWQASATFDALLAEMRADNVEPLVLAMRINGVGTIPDAAIFDCSRWLWEQGGHRAEHLDVRRFGAYAHFPVVRTNDGKVAVAGVGTSSLDFAGGESIWIGWKSTRYSDVLQQRSVTLPATSIDTSGFAAGTYIARMYLDSQRGEVQVYSGAVTRLYPRDPALANLDDYGPAVGPGDNGFPPTLVDMALALFVVNAGHQITAIVEIANTAQSWVTHVVQASSVLYDNTLAANPLSATDVQGGLDELADEKLSIDGSIAMTGDLDMGTNDITNVGDVDGEDVGNLGANAHNQVYPVRMLYRGGPFYFHPQRLASAPDCDWLGFRFWGTGGLRQGGAGGGLGALNKQYDVIAKIDSSADPELQNVTDDGLPDDTEQVLARFNTDGTGVVRYMDLSHWSCEDRVRGMDMHLINSVGAAELEITPGVFVKEGRITPHPATTNIVLTPAGLADRKDSAWAMGVGWRYVYAINLARYNSLMGTAIAGHGPSAYIFISDLAPDYTGGHPTWPTAQFLGAIYCSAAGVGIEEWISMTKRGSKVTIEQQTIAEHDPDVGDSPLVVQLTGIVPITAQSALMTFQMIETTGLMPALVSIGPTPGPSLTAEYPWQLQVNTGETEWFRNLDIPLYRTTPIPSIYLFSTVAADKDVEVYPRVHGYTEDPLRPYFYEP